MDLKEFVQKRKDLYRYSPHKEYYSLKLQYPRKKGTEERWAVLNKYGLLVIENKPKDTFFFEKEKAQELKKCLKKMGN